MYNTVDYLERPYVEYFKSFGVTLIPVPNVPGLTEEYLALPVQGIILSGGEATQARDETESKLVKKALEKNIPILGICKGIEFINLFFGGKLVEVDNHTSKNHKVSITEERVAELIGKEFEVNSFHDYGMQKNSLAPELKPFAIAEDSTVEGLFHPNKPIAGFIWHPERPSPNEGVNKKLIKAFLERRLFWR